MFQKDTQSDEIGPMGITKILHELVLVMECIGEPIIGNHGHFNSGTNQVPQRPPRFMVYMNNNLIGPVDLQTGSQAQIVRQMKWLLLGDKTHHKMVDVWDHLNEYVSPERTDQRSYLSHAG